MKCPVCNIVEMRVKSLINGEITCECPKCHEIVTLKVTESAEK